MKFTIVGTLLVEKQLDELSEKTQHILDEKIEFVENNPFHFDTLVHDTLRLHKIRFSDRRKEKRLVYQIKGNTVRLLFILDRKNDYKDLNHYLKIVGVQ